MGSSYYPTGKICGLTLKKKSRILRVFDFPTLRHNNVCRCPTFKKTVMRLLYDTSMITYIYYEPTDPYYPTSKVLGCILLKRNSQILFFCFPTASAHIAPRCPTFKNCGHEASV